MLPLHCASAFLRVGDRHTALRDSNWVCHIIQIVLPALVAQVSAFS